MPSRIAAVLLLALLAWWSWPREADAQIRRCSTPAGDTLYTDKDCAAIGAVERVPRSPGAVGLGGTRRVGCARTLRDLTHEVTMAIDARDVNRLGAVYHWVGMDAGSGDRVLDRLQVIVDRPLIDIVPVHARRAEPATSAAAPSDGTRTTTDAASTEAASAAPDPELYPQTAVRRAPVGLRLVQAIGKSSGNVQTTFGLRRHLDCWWITL